MNQLARALISGAAGCAGAIVTGGKCAQAAVTAAFASLYNGDRANLGRAFIGTDAQYTLNGKLQEYFPNGNLDHNTTLGGLFGDGRPDWVLDRSSVFNLTTERNSDGAAKDLDRYIETARQKGQTIGIGDANMLLRDGPIVLTSKVITHPWPPADQAGAAARAARMADSGLRPLMRPVATMEQRSA